MKKIFAIAFITLLFCASLFAEDFVVTNIKGKVRYKTSDGVFQQLKEGDIITSETIIDMGVNSELLIKDENQKDYIIGPMKRGTVDKIAREKDSSARSAENSKNITVTRINTDPVLYPDEFIFSEK